MAIDDFGDGDEDGDRNDEDDDDHDDENLSKMCYKNTSITKS